MPMAEQMPTFEFFEPWWFIDDPPGIDRLLEKRGVILNDEDQVTASPEYEHQKRE